MFFIIISRMSEIITETAITATGIIIRTARRYTDTAITQREKDTKVKVSFSERITEVFSCVAEFSENERAEKEPAAVDEVQYAVFA